MEEKEEVKTPELAPDCHKVLMEEEAIRIFGEDCVDFQKNRLLIHFPEITIKNSKDKERTIYDLYLDLNFSFNAEGNIISFSNYVEGFRTTITYEEAYAKFVHPHLEPFYEDEDDEREEDDGPLYHLEPTRFCLGGSSGIESILSTLNMQFSIDQFVILLFSLDDFVRWESLEGGPHIRMSEVRGFGDAWEEITNITSLPAGPNTIDNFYANVNIEEFIELGFMPDRIQTSLIMETEFIEKTMQIGFIFENDFTIAYKYKGKYYNKVTGTSNMTSYVDDMRLDVDYPKFKDEYLDITFINPPKQNEFFTELEKEAEAVMHPGVSKTVGLMVEEELHHFLNRKNTWKLIK